MHWMKKFYAEKHKTYLEQQILKLSVQLNKFFTKYLFSKAETTRFKKKSLEFTVTEIFSLKL